MNLVLSGNYNPKSSLGGRGAPTGPVSFTGFPEGSGLYRLEPRLTELNTQTEEGSQSATHEASRSRQRSNLKDHHPLKRPFLWVIHSKTIHFVAALYLLVLAIQLMKSGAAPIGARLEQTPLITNAYSTLGFGWLLANLILSGSPVAIIALNLFSENVLTPLQTFTMITGSRLGASFVVLLVGVIYSIRRPDKKRTIGMGVLAISWSALVYVPGMFLGYAILRSGLLSGVNWVASSEVSDLIDIVWGPVVDFIKSVVPSGLLFVAGVLVILVAFKLLDRVLPELDSEKQAAAREHWLRKPWPMFALGCLAALLTLSVSVALTVLVPLAAKGHVTRRESIPYIAGANITTLADTLLVAMLLGEPEAVQIVLTTALAVTLITLVILAFLYKPVTKGIMAVDDWVVSSVPRTVGFMIFLFLVPISLLAIGSAVGT